MKKEVLIAVVSGLVIGLIITLGIYTANKALEQQKAKKAASQADTLPSPSSLLTQKTLTVTSVNNYDLVSDKEVTLSGIAWPEAVIALMTETDNFLTQADEEGIYTFKIDLLKGFNELTLVASDDVGETQTLPLVITYSTDEIELPVDDQEVNQ